MEDGLFVEVGGGVGGPDGDIPGLAGLDGEGQAAEVGLDGAEAGGLGVDGDGVGPLEGGDELVEVGLGADAVVGTVGLGVGGGVVERVEEAAGFGGSLARAGRPAPLFRLAASLG